MDVFIANYPGGRYLFSLVVGFMMGAVLVNLGLVERSLRRRSLQMDRSLAGFLRVSALSVAMILALGVSLELIGLVALEGSPVDLGQVSVMAIALGTTFIGMSRLIIGKVAES